MKKTVCLLLACLLLALCACGKGSTPLTRQDFHIYQQGKIILELGTPDLEFFNFTLDGPKHDLDAATLQTKRGTQIGTPLEELAAQYRDIPCMAFSEAMSKEELSRYLSINLEDYLAELSKFNDLILVCEMWESNGLPIYDSDEFVTMIKEQRVTNRDDVYYADIMVFVKDGQVANISMVVKDVRHSLESYLRNG